MKLYYTKGACSLAVRIALNEMGIPAEFESVDLKNKKTETGKDYLTINPKGAVPALLLDNGQVLTENAVVQEYLADSQHASKILPPLNDLNRYKVKEWLNYITTELHKSFGPLFNPELPAEVKDKFFIPAIKKKFDYVNKQLNGHEFLMGDHFTLPDGYLFVMLFWLSKFKIDLTQWPNLDRYYNNLKQRPSIKKSLEEEGLK